MRKLLLILLLPLCLGFSPTINSFNSGQISPLLEARTDFQKYKSSSRTMENMLATVQGPVQRRPGTKFISEVFTQGQYGFGVYGEGIYGE